MTDEELFDEMGTALEARGGWHFEPATTPGSLPSWCLDPGGDVAVAVNVIDGKVVAYLPSVDHEVPLDGVAGLLEWLDHREGQVESE